MGWTIIANLEQSAGSTFPAGTAGGSLKLLITSSSSTRAGCARILAALYFEHATV
jgi:hypothetical protein